MRRETIILLLAGLTGAQPATAQGFGWLFGQQPYRQVPRRLRPRPAPADMPLPVPRPHFPGDDASPADSAKAPEPATPLANEAAETAATPPLPPERPPEIGRQPASEATPNANTPSVDRSSADKPSGGTPPAKEAGPVDKTKDAAAVKEGNGAPKGAPQDTAKPAPTASPPGGATLGAKDAGGTTPPLPPEKPADLAARPSAPTVAPSGATTAFNPREPAADAGCADRLKARGVVAEATVLPPQPDSRCTVVQPMRLLSAKLEDGATVSFPDKPTIACIAADAFSAYVHDLLAPLSRGTWGVGLASVWTGPGLECRSRDHIFGAKLSAHGQGLAVDIAQLKLDDGRVVAVGEPNTEVEQHFETAARAGGCGYFHTVLGPGSDSYHRMHWHFDLEVRGREGDSKYCK